MCKAMYQNIENAQTSWHKDQLLWILIALSLLVYLPTLSFQFTLDDRVHILEDSAQGDLSALSTYFTEPTWPGNLYRPITRATLSLTAAVFGKNPVYYHLGNVLLHVITVILGFAFIRIISTRSMAFSSMLIFACHPILSEAVANIYNRGEMLSAIGVLSVLLIGVTSSRVSTKNSVLLILSTSIACFSKESGFIISLLLAATFWYRRDLRTKMPMLMVVIITSCILFGIRSTIVGGPATGDQQVNSIDNILMMEEQPLRFFHALTLQSEYVLKFLLPLDIRSDYSYAQMLPIKSFTELSFASILIGLLLITTLATKDRIVVFGLLFLFISVLPTANIFVLTGTHFALRLFYLPSLGLLIILSRLLFLLRGSQVVLLSALCPLPFLALTM